MRIAYVYAGADLDRNTGITRKIIEQLQAWQRSGHEVRLFVQTISPTGLSERLVTDAALSATVFADDRVAGLGALAAAGKRLRTLGAVASAVRRWAPTLVYLRFSVSYPPLVGLARGFTTVLEINTDDLQEWRRQLPWYKYLYHRRTRATLLRRASGTVFATTELATDAQLRWHAKRWVVIANGIALDRYDVRPAQPRARRRLVFIGEPGFGWHGVDKVLALARRCPDWEFDLVGYGPEDLGAEAPANLRAHGYLTSQQYGAILADADVALGTLALHRKGMHEACPLKVREYLARGIPTVIGYRDTDFPEGGWFLLQLPNREDNVGVNLGAIRQFVERVTGRRVSREEIAHLDADAKERRRLEFFESVVRDGAGSVGAA